MRSYRSTVLMVPRAFGPTRISADRHRPRPPSSSFWVCGARIPRGRAMRDEERSLLEQTLAIVRGLSHELHADLPGIDRLDASASIERDFWIDSLARVELALRIEQTCRRVISDRALAEADTVRDLVQAMLRAPASATAGALAASPILDAGAAAPVAPTTLLEALEWHALRQADRAHIVFIDDATGPLQMSFGELHAAATAVAAGLVQRGVQPQETVAIMLPTGREFFAAFYGALDARAVPVPLYPPARPSQLEIHLRRLAGILANCEARTLITFEGARAVGHLLRSLDTRL
ncbi:MAG: AMP-binding protein, partial [Proteobacteria bacterium]|nr:AMP-binding protein [Pseudomonadota bacterium]